MNNIRKRDGRVVEFDSQKVVDAVGKAMKSMSHGTEDDAKAVAGAAVEAVRAAFPDEIPSVEDVQDAVEVALMHAGFEDVAKDYILYRARRTEVREKDAHLMRLLNEITFKDAEESNLKRDNANVDGNSAMGTMLQYGATAAKAYNATHLLAPDIAKAHKEGDIHIHDFDFYALTMTCCQIELGPLFKGGFSTGHGFLREPNDIRSYAALACIAIQANQNDQHGGQSIFDFDYGLAPGVAKTYSKFWRKHLAAAAELLAPEARLTTDDIKALAETVSKSANGESPRLAETPVFDRAFAEALTQKVGDAAIAARCMAHARKHAMKDTDKATFQAMEALIHNLNTMHSRAGAQTPFSSINYGMDTSPEGRMVMRNVLLTTEQGLGHGETPIFPIQIFRVKEGVNYNPGEPNYDLFRLACRVSAKRLFPNFAFLDAPYNLQYYKPGHPETEVAYMGCRTRVMSNIHDRTREYAAGRGNLSFTSINLPRLAIESHKDEALFYKKLDDMLALVVRQLLDRFGVQAARRVKNFPFLMGQGVWMDSAHLRWNDEVREVIKHGTLSVGFIGLAETLVSLYGHHHGESDEMQQKGLAIVRHMREYLDRVSEEKKLNFSLLATPAEGLSGRFLRIDQKRYGIIPGVTDKEYYTNSFHIPVGFHIRAFDKINKEGPYHALTNAGHISYVELDGEMARNIKAFETVVRAMHDAGIGYGSINHPVDRDPVCGYNGVIDGDTCPQCGRHESDELVKFERIRRITGYLVGTIDRWNDAKKAEEKDRVKHGLATQKLA